MNHYSVKIMIYKISDTVRFKPADGAIWSIDSPEQVINLTITNCNLLCMLLNNKGVILSRENILEDIWDKQGLRSSNNTLNQYISILRRTFSLLGIDEEVIKTIPKVGFCFNEAISVAKEYSPVPSEIATRESAPKERTQYYFYRVMMSILTLCILALIAYVLSQNKKFSLETSTTGVGQYDTCEIRVLPQYTRGQSRDLLEASNDLIKRNNIKCLPGKEFISKPESRGSGRAFLAECVVDKKRNEYFFCKGYYTK